MSYDQAAIGFFLKSKSGANHHTYGIAVEFSDETAYLNFLSGGTKVRYDIRNIVHCELRGIGEPGPVTDETRARSGDADGGKPDLSTLNELQNTGAAATVDVAKLTADADDLGPSADRNP